MKSLRERFEILRDEALNAAEFGPDAPGNEIFDAVVSAIGSIDDTEPDLDLSLQDALSRRLAWGESPATVVVDCASVCKRLISATRRSFPDSEESNQIVFFITEVACAAAKHMTRIAVQRASKERALQRREMMVQRQLSSALRHQDELIRKHSQNKA